MDGVVIDVKMFSRKEKDDATKKREKKKIERVRRIARKEMQIIRENRDEELLRILNGQVLERIMSASSGEILVRAGTKGNAERLRERLNFEDITYGSPVAKDKKVNDRFWAQLDLATRAIDRIRREEEKEIEKITRGDELPPGVVRMVKVYVAKKRKLSVGDKMAGRTATRGWSPRSWPRRTCPTCPTALRWTSCSIRWACRRE